MFNRDALNPNHETHVPVKVDIPADADYSGEGRKFMPPPSLWQPGVLVTHKASGKKAVVRVIDFYTNQFRAFHPETGENDERTVWRRCEDWLPEVTLSPAEQEKQAAREALEAQIAKLDAKELGLVSVLCDDPDPKKALAKLAAMRNAGLIKGDAEVVAAALEKTETKAAKK